MVIAGMPRCMGTFESVELACSSAVPNPSAASESSHGLHHRRIRRRLPGRPNADRFHLHRQLALVVAEGVLLVQPGLHRGLELRVQRIERLEDRRERSSNSNQASNGIELTDVPPPMRPTL